MTLKKNTKAYRNMNIPIRAELLDRWNAFRNRRRMKAGPLEEAALESYLKSSAGRVNAKCLPEVSE